MDCGPVCLKMIAGYYKKVFSLETIRKKCYITKEGVSFLGLSEAADSLGFRTLGVKIPFERLHQLQDLRLYCHVQRRGRLIGNQERRVA